MRKLTIGIIAATTALLSACGEFPEYNCVVTLADGTESRQRATEYWTEDDGSLLVKYDANMIQWADGEWTDISCRER